MFFVVSRFSGHKNDDRHLNLQSQHPEGALVAYVPDFAEAGPFDPFMVAKRPYPRNEVSSVLDMKLPMAASSENQTGSIVEPSLAEPLVEPKMKTWQALTFTDRKYTAPVELIATVWDEESARAEAQQRRKDLREAAWVHKKLTREPSFKPEAANSDVKQVSRKPSFSQNMFSNEEKPTRDQMSHHPSFHNTYALVEPRPGFETIDTPPRYVDLSQLHRQASPNDLGDDDAQAGYIAVTLPRHRVKDHSQQRMLQAALNGMPLDNDDDRKRPDSLLDDEDNPIFAPRQPAQVDVTFLENAASVRQANLAGSSRAGFRPLSRENLNPDEEEEVFSFSAEE